MEFLDVVDENDNVIGKAEKGDIYKNGLRHRIVHILIFDKKGRMALQLRSRNVSFCPEHWSTAVGGHVQSGESYEQAALREFNEELGASSKLVFLFKDYYEAEGTPSKFLATFKTVYEAEFNIDKEVVEKVCYFDLNEITHMVNSGEKFHPELKFILRKHFHLAI